MPDCLEGFCEGVVFPFGACDEPEEPLREEEEESISSLEESSLRSEVLPELEEAKRCLCKAEKGDIRCCHPILTSSRLWFWTFPTCLIDCFSY